MSTATLTSLAILKTNINEDRDYLDYLLPFTLQVLVDKKPDRITDQDVKNLILEQFGLDIPQRTIHVVLKRISKKYEFTKEKGAYRIVGDLPDPGIKGKKSKAERHIQAVISGLIEFSNTTAKPILSPDHAETAICAFLAKFDISCLRAYLRGTVIPNLEGDYTADIVLVSQYVMHLLKTTPERFESFMIMAQGHMLANALLCPDLQNAPKNYKEVDFYFDTPLLIRRIGLEGKVKQDATRELQELLHNLGGKICAFSHSRDELYQVLRGAAAKLGHRNGRGAIIVEAQRQGTGKSDLLLLAERVEDELADSGIKLKDTPSHIERFQIDETKFEDILDDEVSYHNPRAKHYDIKSVRSIYALRGKLKSGHLEKSRAILATSNSAFARAAWQYGKDFEYSRNVSSVISDFTLANVAWLKAPVGAPSIPTKEILAFSYAALQPTAQLLDKYLREVEKLEKQGRISARDHQILRSCEAYDKLVCETFNDDSMLTSETVTETLAHVISEISQEVRSELTVEKSAHRETQEELVHQRSKNKDILKHVYWQCRRRSQRIARIVDAVIGLILLTSISGFGASSSEPVVAYVAYAAAGISLLLTFGNLVWGVTVKKIHTRVEEWIQIRMIRRKALAMRVSLEEFYGH